jgi:mRNA interferase MazF
LVAKEKIFKRGAVYWADIMTPRGSEPGHRRPIVIVSANGFNVSRIRTVLAVAITSNKNLANAPGNIFIPADKSGLPKDSIINITQIMTVDKQYIGEQITTLPNLVMSEVENSLRLVLDLHSRKFH